MYKLVVAPLVLLAAAPALGPLPPDLPPGAVQEVYRTAERRARRDQLVAKCSQVQPGDYLGHVYEGTNGEKLAFRLFVPPGYDPCRSYPLVLALHPNGVRGLDNERQLGAAEGLLAKVWTLPAAQQRHPCFVLVPQCPRDDHWYHRDANDELLPHPSRALKNVMEVLDIVTQQFSIDAKRLYVTGCSMGGAGTWDAIARWPDRFAAAVPMAASCPVSEAPYLVDKPIWVFHGSHDGKVDVSRSRRIVRAILDAGGRKVRYWEFVGVGHAIGPWGYSQPEMIDWLFDQSL